MHIARLGPWKPWYVWRPTQLAVRFWRGCQRTPTGYRPISVAWGSSILANPTTTVGRSLWTTAVHDLAVSETLARLIDAGDLVIDAGAHVGYMTVLAAIAAGDRGRVLAFEPHPDLFELLERNVAQARAAARLAPVILRNAALGERCADATLAVPPGFDTNDGIARIQEDASAGRSVPIKMETIDAALGRASASVLKIDVEGYELQVLRGAACALGAQRIRHVVFEDFEGSSGEPTRFLQSLGYRVYGIGWSVRGLCLGPASRGHFAKEYEAPSYLATVDERDALERCSAPGWLVLRTHLGRNEPCESRN